LEPFIINLLIKIFESNEDAERVVNKALRARRRRYSKDLTLEDCKIIRKRVFGTVALQLRLAYILEKVVSKSGTLDQKFGFQLKEFGLPLPLHLTGKSNKKEVSKEEDEFMNTLYGTDEVKKGEKEGKVKGKDTKSKNKEDPMQLLHRAECLLAMYILTEESGSKVEFIESDRLNILTKYLDVDEINTEDYYNDIEDPIERISKRHSMPEWIVQRYVEEFDSEGANSLCAALNQPSKTVVRINPEKSSRDKIARALLDSNNPTRMSLDFLKKSASRDSTAQKEKFTVPSLQFQPQSFSDMKFTDLDTSRTTSKNEAEDKETLEKIQAAKGTIYESLIQHKNDENKNKEDDNAAVSAEEKSSSPEDFQSKSKRVTLSETKYSPWGIVVENREVPLTSLELFERGHFDIMNEASQCSVLASGANPWDIVLMYGSKTGVKAHAMASLMRENGMVYCFEEYERQVHQLKSRIERFGTNEVMEIIPDVNAARRIRADLVFVDAICSNSGVFNHHPSIRYRKQEEDLYQTFIPKQKEMLMNAATAVTPGGLLVYTTCSLFREENEDIAEWFANSEAGADFEPEPFDAKGHMRLFAPHIHGSTMDGTFLCRWRRKENEDA
jgi:16S rRNA C967 or C1407 C5-methylase (RsmB/RsmF family)